MPLLDHFHPPVSARKGWEGIHAVWATTIVTQLNGDVLPKEFDAEPRIRVGPQVEDEDVAAAASAPPLTGLVDIADPDTFEVLVYRDADRWKLAAAIEIVSPANKDRPATREAFATKCAAYLAKGVSVVVIDVVTNRTADLHAELVERPGVGEGFAWASPTGLSVVSYRTVRTKPGVRLDVWPTPLAVGAALPTVPLWLAPDLAVPLDLEPPYLAACQVLRLA